MTATHKNILPHWQRLSELLENTEDLSILVLGDYMIDRYLYGDADRISPEAPVPVLHVVRQEDKLGGAGSVVADIMALKAKAFCVGIVGNCPDAEILEQKLRAAGADPSGIVRVPNRPTTRKTRLIGLAQHRHRQQLIRVDDETTLPIDEAHADALADKVKKWLEAGNPAPRADKAESRSGKADSKQAPRRVVCIEDYNKGVVTPRLAQTVIKLATAHGVPVVVDPGRIDDYAHYAGATIVKPNRTETSKLLGSPLPSIDAVRKAAPRILQVCWTQYVCVTLDTEGAALIGPGDRFEHIPTRSRDVYDVTGAGDEVVAALSVAIAAGATMPEAVALANVAGSLEVEKFGCVPITKEEIVGEILLEHHKHLGKIRTLDQLIPELARRRTRNETVAFTNGCFDILHAGHVSNFAFCKQHADILVVGLNSDVSVKRQGKGDDRPIVGQDDRAAVLAAIADVDYVIIFDDDTPKSLIEAVRPNMLIKGRDWQGKTVVGQEFVENNGGKVLLAPMVKGLSTTGLLERIRGCEDPASR